MVPKIPDDILKKLVCDVCHKFLSVQPVKVYPGKKIKCGRCSLDADNGVVSLYGLIADLYRFPCVNRHDGCKKLLVPSQVVAHEKNCQSTRYACPNCWDNKQIPTFLMIEHYREKHRENLLHTPDFSIPVMELLPKETWFLYELKNKLFFIRCSLSDDTVSLNASYLGERNEKEKITQKFILYCRNNRKSTEEIPCLPYNDTGNIRLKVPNLTSVCFQITIYRIVLDDISVTKQAQDDIMMVSTRKSSVLVQSSKSLMTRHGRRMSAALIVADFSEDDLISPRIIFLNEYLRRLKVFSFDSTSDNCLHNYSKKKIFFRCFKCAELKYSISILDNYRYVNVLETEKDVYLGCDVCIKYASTLQVLDSHTITRLMKLNYFTKIQFFCIWNCNEFFFVDKVFEHEIACNKQPLRLCPVNSCSMEGKLFEIEKHFIEHSPEYSLSFNSDITMNLSPTKSPMKHFPLVRNAFVFVELTWTKRLWQMKFMLCGEKDSFAGMKLKAMASDYYLDDNLLGLAQHPRFIEFKHIEIVRIKCFLE